MNSEEVWFSHRERIWDVKNGKFTWTDIKEIWDWDCCTIGFARTIDNKLICVVRSKTNKNSRFMGNKPVELRFMLGFEFNDVSEPVTESYIARANNPDKKEGPKNRWAVHLIGKDRDYWVWEWAKDDQDISSSYISSFHRSIKSELESPSRKNDNIFEADIKERQNELIPVIYQPAVDALNNFVREVHIARNPSTANDPVEMEVSIVFNNEELRKHSYGGILNKIYESFRRLYHGRVMDIETFRIIINRNYSDNEFIFENIYSSEHKLEDDSIHGDKPPAPHHKIKYFFMDHDHPVIFINTSNHAMSEHDTNHTLWKWEYVPWLDNAPVKLGQKSRKELEKMAKPILKS